MDGSPAADDGRPGRRHRAVVLVGALDRRVLPALRFAARLTDADVRALHVSVDPEQTRRLAGDWMEVGLPWLPLHIRDASWPSLLRSVEHAIDEEAAEVGELTVILPEVEGRPWRHRALHRGEARRIAAALRGHRRVATVIVPYFLPAGGRPAGSWPGRRRWVRGRRRRVMARA